MKKNWISKMLAACLFTAVALKPGINAFAEIDSAAAVSQTMPGQTEGGAAQPAANQAVSTQSPSASSAGAASQEATGMQSAAGADSQTASGIQSAVNANAQGSAAQAGTEASADSSGKSRTVIAGTAAVSGVMTEGEKKSDVPEQILGGAELTMFNSRTDSQMLSCMIQTNNGSLIVIDGGLGSDAEYLAGQIRARGGRVAAWLVTHPHGDHVGALYQILQWENARYASGQAADITIDGIYYSFAPEEWYTANDSGEATMAISLIGTLAGCPADMLHSVRRGDMFQIDTASIQVINDRYETATDKGNNAGIVYKVIVNGVSILFLGDMASEGGDRILADVQAGALKSDIVQMAHHGQKGVSQAFYQAVSPSICLWPTPSWLWVSQESKYQIQTTKEWMVNLGVQKHYCMKDGDQVIR